MRRFMQTFVLAPQSPKKYYVHNDIFRYQDEVFHDNDTDTENQEDTVGRLDYWSYSKHAPQHFMFIHMLQLNTLKPCSQLIRRIMQYHSISMQYLN